MTWASPAFAIIAASIAIPTLLILYFLKLRRHPVEISTTLLWKKAIEDLQANAPFQRLRRNLLLFLQLIALAAVLAALGQPLLQDQSAALDRTIILIDRSASMSATDGDDSGASRLAEAKRRAIELVDTMRDAGLFGTSTPDEAMVIAFDTTAEIRQQFTSDKSALRAAINAIEPTDAPSKLEEALRLARAHAPRMTFVDETTGQIFTNEAMSLSPPAAVHIFSDGKIADAQTALPNTDDTVIFNVIGTADARNIGITGLRAQRDFDNPNKLTIFVGLQSTVPQPVTLTVELFLDGVHQFGKSATLAAAHTPSAVGGDLSALQPTSTGVIFSFEQPDATLVGINLDIPTDVGDLLLADNRGLLVVPPARQLSVAFVSDHQSNEHPIKKALLKSRLAMLGSYTPDEFNAALAAGQTTQYDIVVLDGTLPELDDAPGLPEGRFLVFGAVPPPPLGVVDEGRTGPAAMLDWDHDHPVLYRVPLDLMQIGRSRAVSIPPESNARALAHTDRGPAILELNDADTRAIVVVPALGDTLWWRHWSFVAFIGNAIEYLGGTQGGAGETGALAPGGILADRLPADARDISLRPPRGADRIPLIAAPDGRVAYGPIRDAGLYQMRWTGSRAPGDGVDGSRATRIYAANLLDPNESDITAADAITLASRVVQATRAGGAVTRKLWPWLILFALAVIMLEWYIYNRKVYV